MLAILAQQTGTTIVFVLPTITPHTFVGTPETSDRIASLMLASLFLHVYITRTPVLTAKPRQTIVGASE
jgi:hypothetical protein